MTWEEDRAIRYQEITDERIQELREHRARHPRPPVPKKDYCLGCHAEIEWRERNPPDWTLGPTAQYDAGTDKIHWCVPFRTKKRKR